MLRGETRREDHCMDSSQKPSSRLRHFIDRKISSLVGGAVPLVVDDQCLELHPRFGRSDSARWCHFEGFGRAVLLREHDLVYVNVGDDRWVRYRINEDFEQQQSVEHVGEAIPS